MGLKHYRSGGADVYFKNMSAKVNGRTVMLGIAFRSKDSPLGYMPFYDRNDFNCDGATSWKEKALSKLPMDLSAAASPHTLLIRAAAEDPEFAAAGDDSTLDNIQILVRNDLIRHAGNAAAGAFVDGIMVALGGPAIKSFVSQVVQSPVKQFLFSKAISGTARSALKAQGVDTINFLGKPP